MIDKTKEVAATVRLVNDRVKFSGIVEGNAPVSVDYIPPLGDNDGYTSLELFLVSLSTCVGSAVLTFLRRMKKTINDFEISSKGYRNEEHPTGFRDIQLDMILKSPDATEDDLKKVIALAEEKYCPVLSMINGKVRVSYGFRISQE